MVATRRCRQTSVLAKMFELGNSFRERYHGQMSNEINSNRDFWTRR
jgi:hypothetical protein